MRSTIISCLSQDYHKTRIKTQKLYYVVSTTTKAAHTFKHGIKSSIEHINRSTISAMRKRVNIFCFSTCPLKSMARVGVQVCSTIQRFFEITRKAIALLHRHFDTYALSTHWLVNIGEKNLPPNLLTMQYTVNNNRVAIDIRSYVHKRLSIVAT